MKKQIQLTLLLESIGGFLELLEFDERGLDAINDDGVDVEWPVEQAGPVVVALEHDEVSVGGDLAADLLDSLQVEQTRQGLSSLFRILIILLNLFSS